MFKFQLIFAVLFIAGCASTGSTRYTSLQPSTDANGKQSFEFFYSKGALADFENNGGIEALKGFYLPKAMAQQQFCQNGYTTEPPSYLGQDLYSLKGRCK